MARNGSATKRSGGKRSGKAVGRSKPADPGGKPWSGGQAIRKATEAPSKPDRTRLLAELQRGLRSLDDGTLWSLHNTMLMAGRVMPPPPWEEGRDRAHALIDEISDGVLNDWAKRNPVAPTVHTEPMPIRHSLEVARESRPKSRTPGLDGGFVIQPKGSVKAEYEPLSGTSETQVGAICNALLAGLCVGVCTSEDTDEAIRVACMMSVNHAPLEFVYEPDGMLWFYDPRKQAEE